MNDTPTPRRRKEHRAAAAPLRVTHLRPRRGVGVSEAFWVGLFLGAFLMWGWVAFGPAWSLR